MELSFKHFKLFFRIVTIQATFYEIFFSHRKILSQETSSNHFSVAITSVIKALIIIAINFQM